MYKLFVYTFNIFNLLFFVGSSDDHSSGDEKKYSKRMFVITFYSKSWNLI